MPTRCWSKRSLSLRLTPLWSTVKVWPPGVSPKSGWMTWASWTSKTDKGSYLRSTQLGPQELRLPQVLVISYIMKKTNSIRFPLFEKGKKGQELNFKKLSKQLSPKHRRLRSLFDEMLSNKAKKLKVKSGDERKSGCNGGRGRLLSLDGGGIKGLVMARWVGVHSSLFRVKLDAIDLLKKILAQIILIILEQFSNFWTAARLLFLCHRYLDNNIYGYRMIENNSFESR